MAGIGDVIARLSVQLQLNSSQFTQGASQASASANAMGNKMEALGFKIGSMAKAFTAAGVALAGSAVVGAIKDMVTAGLDYASSLGEVATQLGVTTSALQFYRYAATQVGIEQDDMDKGLAKLTLTLGQFALDSVKAEKALTKYGFTTKEVAALSKMTAEEALPFLADKYKALTSDTEKAAFVAELFGSKMGAKFKTLLEGGSKGITDMADAYHKLGIEISPEMIQNADDAADKFAAMKYVLNAEMAKFVSENAGSIIELANAMSEGIGIVLRFYRAIVAFGDSSFGRALGAINEAASYFNPVTGTIKAVKWGLDQYDKANTRPPETRKLGNAWFKNPNPNTMTPGAGGKGTGGAGAGGGGGGGGGGGTKRRTGGGGGGGGGRRSSATPEPTLGEKLSTLQDMLDPAREEGREYAKQIGIADEALKAHLITQNRYLEIQKELKTKYNQPLTTEEYLASMSKVEIPMPDLSGALEQLTKVRDLSEQIGPTFKESADMIGAAVTQLGNSIKSGNFLDILGSVIQIGSQFASAGLFGKTVQTNWNKSFPVPGHAKGTSFHKGGLAMVGERGPELVNMPKGTAVTPNNKLGRGQTSIQVIPSPYFNVVVDGRIVSAAPSIAQAGSQIGMAAATRRSTRRIG